MPATAIVDTIVFDMPLSAWERRYYKTGEAAGLELQVLRRGTASGRWAVALPDGSVGEVEISQRKTESRTPLELDGVGGDASAAHVAIDKKTLDELYTF